MAVISLDEQALSKLKLRQRKIQFFPTACEICGEEYVKEVMWTYRMCDYVSDPDTTNRYVCLVCCPTSDKALKHISRVHYAGQRFKNLIAI